MSLKGISSGPSKSELLSQFLCLVMLVLLINIASKAVEGCSFRCPKDAPRICVSSEVGGIGADCSGFEGCLNFTTPCNEECPPSNPVLSVDKLSCSESWIGWDGNTIRPNCTEETIFCKDEQKCKDRKEPCGGSCNSVWYPIQTKDGKQCQECPDDKKWCRAEKKCFNPDIEHCNKTCYKSGSRYCSATDTCIDSDAPCGTECEAYLRYCEESKSCMYLTDACSGKCVEGKRYCELAGDYTGFTYFECLYDSTPCGESCPEGRQFCFIYHSCIQTTEKCPCSNDRWGCSDDSKCDEEGTCDNACNILRNETLPGNVNDCWITKRGSSTNVLAFRNGRCHPNSELCPGTRNTCVPIHEKLSTCPKDNLDTPPLPGVLPGTGPPPLPIKRKQD